MPPTTTFTVSGIIYDEHDILLKGLAVKAFDKIFLDEQRLGESKTNADGYCEISYNALSEGKGEITTADIFQRISKAAGKKDGESLVSYNLPYKGISEFDRIVGDMEVLLDGVRFKDRRIGRK